jgi:NTE family protein
MTRPRTAFVLAGGGSLAAAQVGMLAELCHAGECPDLLVGVSAGAINAAVFAKDVSATTVARMGTIWGAMTSRRALGLSWRSALGLIGLQGHVAHAGSLRGLLGRELGYDCFAAAAVPLHVVCADLVTGEEVVLSDGSLVDAIVASAAIPGVFPPVQIGARRLIDGAVAANTPIATAIRLGATRVVVLPAGFACAAGAVPGHAFGRAMHAISLLGARQLKHDFERYAATYPIHVVPPLCPVTHSSYDYRHAVELIDRARRGTHDWIAAGGLGRREFPGPLAEHAH